MLSLYTPLIIFAVTAIGFTFYIFLAQRRRTSRVGQFYLGGRNIGLPLFTQTTWGNSFAFGNSIFYAVWLGYTLGLSALWLQALWAVDMICYALLLPQLIKPHGEVHLAWFLRISLRRPEPHNCVMCHHLWPYNSSWF
jgi:Na+/proline symporter